MARRETVRPLIKRIPLLPRIEGGPGRRIELKIDITPKEITVSGLNENHTQSKNREVFHRTVEEYPATLSDFFSELVVHAVRTVPREI